MEQVNHTFGLRYARPSKKQDPHREMLKKRIILENVCESDMDIRVIFDQLQLELHEIMQLQPDDVIPLGKKVGSDVLVTVLNDIVTNGEEVVQWEKIEASS